MNAIDQPCALLGGLSPADFMRHYWQKKPLLIRGAMPGFKAPITRNALFALAQRDEVESRLVVQSGAKNRARSWSLTRGPFARRSLPPLAQKAWSLLVQGVNLYEPKAHEILEQFNFDIYQSREILFKLVQKKSKKLSHKFSGSYEGHKI